MYCKIECLEGDGRERIRRMQIHVCQLAEDKNVMSQHQIQQIYVFTHRRPEQIADAILYDLAVRVVLDFILLPIIILFASTSAITLVHVRAVAVDVKAQQAPRLGVLVVVRLATIDELLGVVTRTKGKKGAIADGSEMAGGLGILVAKVVGLILEARTGLVAAKGDPILSCGGEIVLVEKSLDGGYGCTTGPVDGRSRSDGDGGGEQDGSGSGGSEHRSLLVVIRYAGLRLSLQ